jgi:hypothetical protein
LGLIPAEAKFFTCLYFKDTFFYICLAAENQPIFAFQWESPNIEEKGQWIWLLQVFKNSLTIFGTALASNPKAFSADQHGCTLLQYVICFLLAGPTQEYMKGTLLLFSLL